MEALKVVAKLFVVCVGGFIAIGMLMSAKVPGAIAIVAVLGLLLLLNISAELNRLNRNFIESRGWPK